MLGGKEWRWKDKREVKEISFKGELSTFRVSRGNPSLKTRDMRQEGCRLKKECEWIECARECLTLQHHGL